MRKYKIDFLLLKLNVLAYDEARQRIIDECEITPQTLLNWRNIKVNDTAEIKRPNLEKIAEILNVAVDDLITETALVK